jgi:hypothetical protein
MNKCIPLRRFTNTELVVYNHFVVLAGTDVYNKFTWLS